MDRICFQVEEAQWFYEDFIRPLDPSLPFLSLKAFSLKIFQHCPLFSEWDAHNYAAAFEEFLQYKSRVPVRGAIMLNDAMDEAVLVKGWKKGANWGFPRGKINKDESNLDCAVREVYEETGFDIQAAGLVKAEKDMKYIEVKMKEKSDMRLYVFRGVPRDTHFEPQTRKEISKIEWYKLTDLPAWKKHKGHGANGEGAAISSSKFFMVVPFLQQLKSWISQQRKAEQQHHNVGAKHLAPFTTVEEFVTEEETDVEAIFVPPLATVRSFGPSDLPEVSVSKPSYPAMDPSAELKHLLKMTGSPEQSSLQAPQALPNVDTGKSNALLALLRGESTPELRADPKTPSEHIGFHPNARSLPPGMQPRPHQAPLLVSPQFSFPVTNDVSHHQPAPTIGSVNSHSYASNGRLPHPSQRTRPYPQQESSILQSAWPNPPVSNPSFETTDHQRMQSANLPIPTRPLSDSLPSLTNHTKALLDVFKRQPNPTQEIQATYNAIQQQPKVGAPRPESTTNIPSVENPNQGHPLLNRMFSSSAEPATVVRRPKSTHQESLLDLFRKSSMAPTPTIPAEEVEPSQKLPAELAANPASAEAKRPSKIVSRGGGGDVTHARTARRIEKAPGEGETAATITSPLNLPQFEGLRSSRRTSQEPKRSPVPANRTLYDPKQPTPVKILPRPNSTAQSPARSPRPNKEITPSGAASPKRTLGRKEAPKPFQPQILRRPQANDSRPSSVGSIDITSTTLASTKPDSKPVTEVLPPLQTQHQIKPIVQSGAAATHKQTLLSLFGKPIVAEPPATMPSAASFPDTVSPLTASQLMSPLDQEPISTRSRVGSLASTTGGNARPHLEKRQTTAGDKAFLLGYLSRIASQGA